MAGTNDSLLYLVYGQGPHYDEAVYSILSALHLMGPDRSRYRIVVYTDSPDAFADLPVCTELLSARVLNEWSGPQRVERPLGVQPSTKDPRRQARAGAPGGGECSSVTAIRGS